MSVLHIAYDLNRPGQSYDALITALQKAGAKKILYSGWLIRTSYSPSAVRDWVRKFVDANDRVFVTEVANSAWYNIPVNPNQV
jgi:hypothetical protein